LEKKIFFVYVNTGNGFNPISKTQILEFLNKNSYNQIFRKWILYDPRKDARMNGFDTSILNGLDTINLSHLYQADSTKFLDADLIKKIPYMYNNQKGISLHENVNEDFASLYENKNTKVHCIFIMNYELPVTPGASSTIGISDFSGAFSVLWKKAFWDTRAHEFGHLLKLAHTFNDLRPNGTTKKVNFNIPYKTTKNFMDYSDYTDMYYFAQWVLTF
jgi:hypothetical protein